MADTQRHADGESALRCWTGRLALTGQWIGSLGLFLVALLKRLLWEPTGCSLRPATSLAITTPRRPRFLLSVVREQDVAAIPAVFLMVQPGKGWAQEELVLIGLLCPPTTPTSSREAGSGRNLPLLASLGLEDGPTRRPTSCYLLLFPGLDSATPTCNKCTGSDLSPEPQLRFGPEASALFNTSTMPGS